MKELLCDGGWLRPLILGALYWTVVRLRAAKLQINYISTTL